MYAALWYTLGAQPQVHLGYLTVYLQLRYNNGVCAGPFGPRGLGVEPPVVSGSKNDWAQNLGEEQCSNVALLQCSREEGGGGVWAGGRSQSFQINLCSTFCTFLLLNHNNWTSLEAGGCHRRWFKTLHWDIRFELVSGIRMGWFERIVNYKIFSRIVWDILAWNWPSFIEGRLGENEKERSAFLLLFLIFSGRRCRVNWNTALDVFNKDKKVLCNFVTL